MSHRTLLALVLGAAALSGGCGTIHNVKLPAVPPEHNPNAELCQIYGGVRNDWNDFWHYPWNPGTPYCDYVFIPLLGACNLCLDGVGDTITLPCTAVKAMRRAISGSKTPASVPVEVAVPEVATGGQTPPVTQPQVTLQR